MFSTLFFPLFPMDQVILKSWEEKKPSQKTHLTDEETEAQEDKTPARISGGSGGLRALALCRNRVPASRASRAAEPAHAAHGVSGKAGVAPGAGAPKGVSQAQVPEGARESTPGSVCGRDSVSGVVCVRRAHLTGKKVSFRP